MKSLCARCPVSAICLSRGPEQLAHFLMMRDEHEPDPTPCGAVGKFREHIGEIMRGYVEQQTREARRMRPVQVDRRVPVPWKVTSSSGTDHDGES